ncbi:XVIPCD domain-containing protein [Luteimonas soli]|uniref:XVIPCD domain-containing protein n=1 Tax=Luteimonas soli TaxID=1648966 RepID=A0ABV7XPX1_9GAMM
MNREAEFDIRASADQVVELLQQQRTLDAIEQLERYREGQPRIIQEALDRYVATDARAMLDALARDPRAVDAAPEPVLERLQRASRAPRFPGQWVQGEGSEPDTIPEIDALTQAQRFDVYASIVAIRGNDAARDALDGHERVILGLRQENTTLAGNDRDKPFAALVDLPGTPERDESRAGTGVYDDRIVVLWKEADGTRRVFAARRGNTEPTAQYDHHAGSDGRRVHSSGGRDTRQHAPSSGYEHIVKLRKIEGEDVDRDGLRDLGRLSEGTVEMQRAMHPRPGGRGALDVALRPTAEAVRQGEGRVQRDTNADGWFTQADVDGIQALNDSFKIHRGSRANTDSAGCQTIHPDEYNDFINAVTGNPAQTRWQYVLTSTTPGMWRNVEDRVNGMPEVEAPTRNRPGPAAPGRNQDARPHPRGPADPGHPDHALLLDIRERVHGLPGLDCGNGKRAENLCRALLPVAKASGLRRVDHVVLGVGGGRAGAGENIFLVQGALNDPAHLRTFAKTEAAMATPTPASDQRLEDVNRQLADAAVQAQVAIAQQPPHGLSPMRV